MPQLIELVEYEQTAVSPQHLSPELGEWLWRQYDTRLLVEFPSPKTAQQWRLTSQGWVGIIPASPELTLLLQPKVPLHNLFGMWHVAYHLPSFRLLDGAVQVTSLADFYQQLARLLAEQVLQRARQGFYRAYVAQEGKRPFLRGQLLTRQLMQPSPNPLLTCRYEEQTADLPHNQLLAYTLERLVRSGLCAGEVETAVRRAAHTLLPLTTAHPFTPDDCTRFSYNRLNQDYQRLHALCRFLLAHTGPAHRLGSWQMQPFLVDMARLFELFVAEWLRTHLPNGWRITAQERLSLGTGEALRFEIDLVLYDPAGRVHAVLDTKYKAPDKTSNPDFNQVVTYAKAKECREAVLIYPTPLPTPLDVHLGDLHVRSLTFALDGDLETAGQQFLADLLDDISNGTRTNADERG